MDEMEKKEIDYQAAVDAAREAETAAIQEEEKKKEKIGEWDGWKGWVRDIVTCFLLAGLILCFVKPTVVQQHSMENTLEPGDYLLLSRQAYTLFGEPERGDIVVFKSDMTDEKGRVRPLVKRVIGLPGDTVSISGGLVYINGEPLIESYTKDGYTQSNMDEVTVPEDCLFCMGDNRQKSLDSRSSSVGFVPISQVMGRAFFRLFPVSRIGRLYIDLEY